MKLLLDTHGETGIDGRPAHSRNHTIQARYRHTAYSDGAFGQAFKSAVLSRDPFDRLIIAQAIDGKMTVLSDDGKFADYPIELVFCGESQR